MLDCVRPAKRIRSFSNSRLVSDHLLRSERHTRRSLGRQRECFVHRVRMQRLRSTKDRRERLDRRAYYVYFGLLRGQRRAGSLRVKPQHQRARIARLEAIAHDARP